MFKRLFCVLASLLFLCSVSFAEIDVSSMSDSELKELIAECSNELRKRAASDDPAGIVLFDQGGMRLYQIGDAYLNSSGRLTVPCLLFNDTESSTASLDPVFAECNGVSVNGYLGSWVSPQSSANVELDFATEDLQLKSIDDIFSLSFQWQIYAVGEGVLLLTPESEEHRFW